MIGEQCSRCGINPALEDRTTCKSCRNEINKERKRKQAKERGKWVQPYSQTDGTDWSILYKAW